MRVEIDGGRITSKKMTLQEFFIKLRELDGSWVIQGVDHIRELDGFDGIADMSLVRRISDGACPVEAIGVDLFGYDLHAARKKKWGAAECSYYSGIGLSMEDAITIILASDYESHPYRKKLRRTVGIDHY